MSFENLFNKIISLENLLLSWREFKKGKQKKFDIQLFEANLENNLFSLHRELLNKKYKHSNYTAFNITDPKLRHIHKASVKDRLVHHAIYRVLYPLFDRSFIFDSYSCRLKKGTHKAVLRLEKFARKTSSNYSIPCYSLKCDIRKYFDSINHNILLNLIAREIKDQDCLWLIKIIIFSFQKKRLKGLPIGNITSQLFANIYLNELDKFIKKSLKIKYYIRYCDDFVVIEKNHKYLNILVTKINKFLKEKLNLNLHQDKILIQKLNRGIDFLGYITFPYYRYIRTKTKHRILKRICNKNKVSYFGLLKHCNSYKLLNLINSQYHLQKFIDILDSKKEFK